MLHTNKPKRVGILVVHGIGNQCQFEHLEQVVRNIASALQADSTIASVQVNVNASKDAPYGAKQQIWRGEGTPTVIIEVVEKNKQQTNLEFREVWWSDLDEPNSIRTFLSFWSWSLSLWTKPSYDQRHGKVHPDMRLPGRTPQDNKKDLLPGVGEPIRCSHRIYLILVSFVVLLFLPLLWISGRVLRSVLGLEIRPDILVEYLGDIKLYQQDAREGKGPLVDLGKVPPRFSIRRRLIKAVIEMSLEEYDRWYILSHSLGTVVALNGLMETEIALPRYLDQKSWERWCHKNQGKVKKQLTPEQKEAQKAAILQRPSWLSPDDDDIIDREKLFCKLKGFMTYGSPLSKFAVLWPLIVPLNNSESVFREDFEWINVFDPTDPVSDFTRFFNSAQGKSSLTPMEIPYKAGQIHLLSHGQYLTFNPKRKNPLVCQVSRWILSGERFKKPQEPRARKDKFFHRLGWPISKSDDMESPIVSIYFSLGIFIWFLLGLSIPFALSWLVPLFLDEIPQLLAQLHLSVSTANDALLQVSHFLSVPLSHVGITLCIVAIVGGIAWLFGLNKNRVI